MNTRKELEEELSKLNLYKEKILKQFSYEPEGRIATDRRSKDYIEFYLITNESAKAKYISKENKELISLYLQKRYNHSVIKDIEKQIATIEQFLDKYKENAIQEHFYKIHNLCQEYVKVLEYPDEEYAKMWQAKKYQGNPYPIDSREFITNKGEKVRSKSEVIIANCLKDACVPYRYEYPLTISNAQKMYPDFTVLNKRTREIFIWEHFGKMDSEDYRQKAFNKLNLYATVGFFPGRNLITTFEDYRNPVNVAVVKKIIKEYLL